jgi:hypothetical protein
MKLTTANHPKVIAGKATAAGMNLADLVIPGTRKATNHITIKNIADRRFPIHLFEARTAGTIANEYARIDALSRKETKTPNTIMAAAALTR